MGCDIHVVIEEKMSGEWVGVVATDRLKTRPIYAERDYAFFAEIANVRGRGTHYPQNVPIDLSKLAWNLYMDAPTDHHSASYMDVQTFCNIHHQINPSKSRSEHCAYDLTGLWLEDGEFRVVFWFDN